MFETTTQNIYTYVYIIFISYMYRIPFCSQRNSSQESVCETVQGRWNRFYFEWCSSQLPNDSWVQNLQLHGEFESSQMHCKFLIPELSKATPIPSTVPASRNLIWHVWIITATIMFAQSPSQTTRTLPNWADHPQHLCSLITHRSWRFLVQLIWYVYRPRFKAQRLARKPELNSVVQSPFQAFFSME